MIRDTIKRDGNAFKHCITAGRFRRPAACTGDLLDFKFSASRFDAPAALASCWVACDRSRPLLGYFLISGIKNRLQAVVRRLYKIVRKLGALDTGASA